MTKIYKGFTLIELLVVVAIIGLLAAIVFVSFGNVTGDARDARKRADMTQIKTAMEFCFSDIACGGAAGEYVDYTNMAGAQIGGIGSYVAPNFLPSNPSGGAYTWECNTTLAGCRNNGSTTITEFCVEAVLEDGTTPISASHLGVGEVACSGI